MGAKFQRKAECCAFPVRGTNVYEGLEKFASQQVSVHLSTWLMMPLKWSRFRGVDRFSLIWKVRQDDWRWRFCNVQLSGKTWKAGKLGEAKKKPSLHRIALYLDVIWITYFFENMLHCFKILLTLTTVSWFSDVDGILQWWTERCLARWYFVKNV